MQHHRPPQNLRRKSPRRDFAGVHSPVARAGTHYSGMPSKGLARGGVHFGQAEGDPPEKKSKFPDWLKLVYMVSTPVAMGLSYNKNKSIGWALLHGFVSVPYLVYYAASQR